MCEKGHSLIEILIILPLILSIVWLCIDALIIYRDEYIIHYALFHSLRMASPCLPNEYDRVKLGLVPLLAIGEKGTGEWMPLFSAFTDNGTRLSSSIKLLRQAHFAIWPPTSSTLSVQKELVE